jgi:hypothetical protein
MGGLTHVPAILKLAQIARKVLLTDMDMCAIYPTLHRCPEAFDPVGAGAVKANIFMGAVVDRHVTMAALVQAKVGAQFVSMDCAARNDIGVAAGNLRDTILNSNLSSIMRGEMSQIVPLCKRLEDPISIVSPELNSKNGDKIMLPLLDRLHTSAEFLRFLRRQIE